jgi:glycosyltransferase involved in cell wall biosynthesis
VIPVRNERASIGAVLDGVAAALASRADDWEIVVVDDASDDGSGDIARDRGARVVTHPYRKGNGAAVKSGIRAAAGTNVVLLDGDGQHPPEAVPQLVAALDTYDMVVAARSGMGGAGAHRWMANRLYNALAGYVAGHRVEDLTSGFRAARRAVLMRFLYLFPNTFSYPTTSTLAFFKAGYSVGYVPVAFRAREGASKVRLLQDGIRFLLIIARIATLFSPMKIFLPCSLASAACGVVYGAVRVCLYGRYSPFALFFLSTGVLIFLMGLVAEQVACLRLERVEEE